MRQAHDVATIRAAETALMASLPPGTLMDRASFGLAATAAQLLQRVYGSRVVLLVGSGDNGGDALFAGALLARRGAIVSAVLLGSSAHVAGLAALRAAGGRVEGPDAVLGADLVLDGIVGIGGAGALREAAAEVVSSIPVESTVLAVDVPSGVDADTGVVAGAAVHAHVTVTFGTWKPGLLIDPGAQCAGAVEFVDIGLGPWLPTASITALQAPMSSCRYLRRSRTSTAAESSASWPAARRIRVRPCSRRAARCGPARAWCASSLSRIPPSSCERVGPKQS